MSKSFFELGLKGRDPSSRILSLFYVIFLILKTVDKKILKVKIITILKNCLFPDFQLGKSLGGKKITNQQGTSVPKSCLFVDFILLAPMFLEICE